MNTKFTYCIFSIIAMSWNVNPCQLLMEAICKYGCSFWNVFQCGRASAVDKQARAEWSGMGPLPHYLKFALPMLLTVVRVYSRKWLKAAMKCHYGHRSCVFVFPLPNYVEGPVMHPSQTRSWDQTFQGWVVNKGIKVFTFFRRKCFVCCFFLKKNIAGKLDLNHFPVYFGLSFLTSSSETLFFDAVVTFNDAIKRKTNQTIPQSGEVKSLLQHTSPGIFWNPLWYNVCACVIIDLSSGANKQGCDYSLYTYKVFLCLRVWEGWLHPLRNDPIQRQLYHSFIKNLKKKSGERQHTLLPSCTAGVGGPLWWKTPAETTKKIWFQHLKWMSAEQFCFWPRPTPGARRHTRSPLVWVAT